DFEDYEFD
nr:Chain D, Asp-phe-glu-asp-tyr-glu-phe-asp [synthetic construct]5WRI_E Chain E, Asp-phe-glu-asp-tyr-glu-phe-asp [synthetic construct]